MPEATIILKAGAVADYRVTEVARHKLKKTGDGMLLQLEPNPDILADLGRIKGDRLLVGFAAETENLIEEARRKLNAKNCDMVVANYVGQEGTGFESEDNEVVLVLRTGESIPLERMPKRQVADRILDQVVTLRRALHATP
jgi:phosphopantothenoylcysteine decarboxylase/phosphopantothenate--cysteine ligase